MKVPLMIQITLLDLTESSRVGQWLQFVYITYRMQCFALYTHTHTHTNTHTHIYTYTHIRTHIRILVLTTARTGYVASSGVRQQEARRLVVLLAAGTPALFPQLHGPLGASGYSSMGLQDP